MANIIKNRNLVVVRAGENSLHESWLGDASERNWDIIVSSFGKSPEKWERDDVINVSYQGGNHDGFFDALRQVPTALKNYDFILKADDDYEMSCPDINSIFALTKKYNLWAGLPSHSFDSYLVGGYFQFYNNPNFKMRLTNFVEHSTLCMKKEFVERFLPLWEDNPLALGIDFFWARLADDPKKQIGVLDEVQVKHTRELRGPLHQKFRNENGKRNENMERGFNPVQFTTKNYTPPQDMIAMRTHAGLTKRGFFLTGQWVCLPLLLAGWLKNRKRFDKTKYGMTRMSFGKAVGFALLRQCFGKNDWSKIKLSILGKEVGV